MSNNYMNLTIMNLYKEYHEFALRYFNFLKSNILIDFPYINLNVIYDINPQHAIADNITYEIRLYMYELNQKYFTNRLYIKNSILYALTHEAFHQLQAVDRSKYISDKSYQIFIEKNCDFTTMEFINKYNTKIQMAMNMIIYNYDLNVLDDIYGDSPYCVSITKKNIEYKYIYNLINKFLEIPEYTVYYQYNKYKNINFIFSYVDRHTNKPVRNVYNIMIDGLFNKQAYDMIFAKYLKPGYLQKLERGFISYDDNSIEYEISIKDIPIKSIYRIQD